MKKKSTSEKIHAVQDHATEKWWIREQQRIAQRRSVEVDKAADSLEKWADKMGAKDIGDEIREIRENKKGLGL